MDFAQAEKPGETDAATFFESAVVWDNHSGFMPDPAAALENLSIWKNAGGSHLSINVGFDLMPWQDCITTLSAFRRWLLDRPTRFILASTATDVRRAKAEGKMSVTFDLEGMNALNERLDMVSLYHHLGVKQMLFAYNRNNAAAGGCHDEDTGLTAFGRGVIDEMNRLGMFVDVSHCGYRSSMEVMEYSGSPVIFSHSNPAARWKHGRNISDEQIRACAATGGVIGAVGVSLFLGERPSAELFADHVEHLIQVAGPKHVGIGLDYGFPVDVDVSEIVAANPQFWPTSEGYHGRIDFLAPSILRPLADILLRRGHSEKDVRGVLGENFLDLAERLWR
ncbi:dipeptidase [Sphingosinicella sp.]|uniref:dipeptidase n=1 Tax=Sphingosinicella sp. TaxID=1917971 RepID=UPI0035B34850